MASNADDFIDILDEMKDTRIVSGTTGQNTFGKKLGELEIYVKNVKWRLTCSPKQICIQCITSTGGTFWSIDARFDIKYTTTDGNTVKCDEYIEYTFSDSESKIFPLKTAKNVNPVMKYEVNITVKNIRNLPRITKFDDKISNLSSDVILLIEGKKFRVNKEYLSKNSPVFDAMFNSDFMEKNQKQIEIKETSCEAFHEFLRIIFFRNAYMDSMSFNFGVLEIAYRYAVQWIIDYCEDRLIITLQSQTFSSADGVTLLQVADVLKLNKLQEAVCNMLTKCKYSRSSVEKLAGFGNLSRESKYAIYKVLH